MNQIRAVPSLDELAEHPERAADLPVGLALDLNARAVRVLAALAAPMMAHADRTRTEQPDQLLDVAEAAARIGQSPHWLYRHARQLPFTVQRGRRCRLRFSSREIDRYLREGSVSF